MNELALWQRNILIGILLCVYFFFGVLKWNYIINPWLMDGDFFLYRYSKLSQASFNKNFTDPIRYFLFTPKWASTLIYGNVFLGLNLAIIYLVHQNQMYIRFTFWLFFWISGISVGALAIGMLTHTFDSVYTIVARIKELQQSPFTLILLLGAFKVHSKNQI